MADWRDLRRVSRSRVAGVKRAWIEGRVLGLSMGREMRFETGNCTGMSRQLKPSSGLERVYAGDGGVDGHCERERRDWGRGRGRELLLLCRRMRQKRKTAAMDSDEVHRLLRAGMVARHSDFEVEELREIRRE